MDTAVFPLVQPMIVPDSLGHELDVDSVIRRVISGKQPLERRMERRLDARYAYPYPLTLTPIEAVLRGNWTSNIAAIGKHITVHGLDFYTTAPLAAKEVICQFHLANVACSLVIELTWCRHNSQGWFENGGKFVRVWKAPASMSA